MNHSLRDYRKALKTQLCCCCRTRRRLLAHFDQMAALFLEEHPAPSPTELTNAFGTPQELAIQLMEEVSGQERREYQHRRLLLRIIVAVLIIGLAGLVFWLTQCSVRPMEVSETLIIYEEVAQ